MVSSYSFRICWAGKEDRLGYSAGMGWDVEANMDREDFVCGVSSGRALVSFPSMLCSSTKTVCTLFG